MHYNIVYYNHLITDFLLDLFIIIDDEEDY